ncbi:hypothetical protein L6R52_44210 [Myxococcota bacterium]|nr:hypothetical protein [Myxococcota bacterium]
MPRLDVDAPRAPALGPQVEAPAAKPVAPAVVDRGPAANEDQFEVRTGGVERSLLARLASAKTAVAAVLAGAVAAAVLAVSLGTQSPSAPGVPLEPATGVTVVKQDPPDAVTTPRPGTSTPAVLQPAPRTAEPDGTATPGLTDTTRLRDPATSDRTDLTPRTTGPSTPLRPIDR